MLILMERLVERRDGDGLIDEYNEDEAGIILLELLSSPEPEESNNEAF